MNAPEGTGSRRGQDPDEGFVLPSWIDAAIAKTRGDEPAADEPDADEADVVEASPHSAPSREGFPDAEPEYSDYEFVEPRHAHRERVDETEAEEETPESDDSFEHAPAAKSSEPFPSFLDRSTPMFSRPEPWTPPAEPSDSRFEPRVEPQITGALAHETFDEFEEQRASIVSEALAEPEEAPVIPLRSDPIPLPVAPRRRRPPSGPWLMAAIFFAAAAIVLAVLIWLRPLQP